MKIYGADTPRQFWRTLQESGRYVRKYDRENAQAKPFSQISLYVHCLYMQISHLKSFFFFSQLPKLFVWEPVSKIVVL